MNLKSKDTHFFMQNLRGKRDLSPTLRTAVKKIINNPRVLDYCEDSEEKHWAREVNENLFEFGQSNALEDFFLAGMAMRDALNGDMSRALGKVFFHSNLCLPAYLFRASKCLSRLLLAVAAQSIADPEAPLEPDVAGPKHDADLLNLSFDTNSPSLRPNKPKKLVSKSIDLGNKPSGSPRRTRRFSLPSQDPRSRLFFGLQLLELLQFNERQGDKAGTNLKRFMVLSLEEETSGAVSVLRRRVHSDALKVTKAPRVESHEAIKAKKRYRVGHRVQDTLFKRLLGFLLSEGLLTLEAAQLVKLRRYTHDLAFDPFLNLFSDFSRSKSDPMSFLAPVYTALNNDLRLFLDMFFLYDIRDFMSLRRNIKFGYLSRFNLYSGSHLRHLNISDHLFLQRTLLPFGASAHRELRVGVCTWNLAGKNMLRHEHLLRQICRKLARANPDIAVLGFQEIVEMKISWSNLKNIMFKCNEISLQIKGILDRALGKAFICVSALNLMGMLQLVYVHFRRYEDLVRPRFVNWEEKFGGKAGFKMGNKGAVGSVFELRHFGVFSFSNCHLTHGFDKVAKRVQKLLAIIEAVRSRPANAREQGRADGRRRGPRRRPVPAAFRLHSGRLQHADRAREERNPAHSLRRAELPERKKDPLRQRAAHPRHEAGQRAAPLPRGADR